MRLLIFAFCLIVMACAPIQPQTSTPLLDLDTEMEAAYSDARNALNIFIERIGAPHSTRTFVAVKTRFFPADGSSQDIWVDEVTYKDGFFHGSMGDDIPSLKLFASDPVKIKPEAVFDWMIVEDGKLIGGYTIKLAYQRMSPEEKENFLESLNYSLDE